MLPADSLSRQQAESVPADTLRLAWRVTGDSLEGLRFPRTVRFGPGGQLYVSDVEAGRIFVFSGEGRLVDEWTSDGFSTPYLSGVRGDTVVVFNPAALRLDPRGVRRARHG